MVVSVYAQGMRILFGVVLLCGAFSLGWVISKRQVLKEYPPETVRFITETKRIVGEVKPAEQLELLKRTQQQLSSASQQFDYLALHEGFSARYFQIVLDREGEAAGKALAVKQIQKFRERFENGINLPADQKELAAALYESTTGSGE